MGLMVLLAHFVPYLLVSLPCKMENEEEEEMPGNKGECIAPTKAVPTLGPAKRLTKIDDPAA